MANVVSILVRADGSNAVRELRRVERSLLGVDKTGSAAGGRLRRALGTAVVAGTRAAAVGVAGLGYGLYKAVSAAGDFEQQLNVLKAVSGATGNEMKRISALSIRLGKDVTLPATSAQDAAVAMTELAKGGLSVRDSMAAAKGALQLAAAGEVDVGTAASLTATSLNQFHLAGTSATKVADLLAGAANASAGNVSDFAQGLQYAGTAAHAAGQSITLTVAALAEMANAGLSGEVAGTSLSNALRALQAPTAKAQDAMKKFNLSVYDAHGKMKPLDQIAATFSKNLGNLTQKTQNATLAQIFGSRAVQAARIVFLGGKDALDKYATTVGKSGNASRLAEARMKGFRGALQAFQSNLETIGITIGLKLLPTVTDLLHKLNDLANSPATANFANQAVQGFMGLYDAGVSVAGAMQSIYDTTRPVADVFATLAFNEATRDLTLMGGAAYGAVRALSALASLKTSISDMILNLRTMPMIAINPWALAVGAAAAGITAGFLLTRDTTEGMATAMDDAKRATDSLADALRNLKSDTLDVRQAELDRKKSAESLTGINKRLSALAKSGKKDTREYKDLLGQQTQAEIDLGRAKLRVSDATAKQVNDQEKLTAGQNAFIRSLHEVANAANRQAAIDEHGAGVVKIHARALAIFTEETKKLAKADAGVAAQFRRSDPPKAKAHLRAVAMSLAAIQLRNKINDVPTERQIKVYYKNHLKPLIDQAHQLRDAIAGLHDKTILIRQLTTIETNRVSGRGYVVPHAAGGIIMKPLVAGRDLFGEAGREAVIPLDDPRGRKALSGLGGVGLHFHFPNAVIVDGEGVKRAAKMIEPHIRNAWARRG